MPRLAARRALRPTTAFLTGLACASMLVACGSSEGDHSDGTESQAQDNTVTVHNCGEDVTVPSPPENVVVLKSASVPTLSRLGVLDRVEARAGVYPPEYYDERTNSELEKIPSLTDKLDASGHLQISREEVVGQGADLVIGMVDTVNRETMADTGVPVVEEAAFCDDLSGDATWDDVWDQIRLYGTIFDREDEAEAYITELKERLTSIEDAADPAKANGEPYTVAVLYPTIGGGVTYAYGSTSASAPVVTTAGAKNAFADEKQRVFEVSGEDIVNRNPDAVIALYSEGEADAVADAVRDLPGFDTTTAGENDAILPLMFNYGEPPTPLTVDGAEKIHDYLAGL